MSNLSTLPKGDSAWLLRKAIERIIDQVSVLETNIGVSTSGNSADTQIIFNDNGTLRGDAGLVYNKTTDALTVAGLVTAGSATITGDLTVDTSTLKVDSTNNRVGILTASPRSSFALDVLGNVALGNSTTTTSLRLKLDCAGTAGNIALMSFASAGTNKVFYGLSGGYLGDASTDAIIATDAAGAAIRFYVSDTGSEAMRLNSTGLGIGVSPTQKLHVRGNILTGSAAGTDSYLNITTDGVQNSYFGFNNSGSTNASGASNNNTYIGSGNNYPVQIVSNGALVATFSSSTVRIANNNIVMATSGTGIDFSATANSSGTMTSELLNDYEEGTFTPTVGGSTLNGTAVYSAQTGFYTKIGRLVQFQILVGWSVGTATGNQTVLGLPFTSNSATNNVSILSVYAINIALTAGSYATASIPANSSLINLFQLPTGGGPDSSVPCDAAGTLIITGTYFV